MRRFAFRAMIVAAGMMTGGPASAWLVYPPDDRPDALIVEIERQVVDVVPLRSLPPPFDTALGDAQTAEKLSYRWRYGRTAQGRAALVVDGEGRGTVRVEFGVREPFDGVRYGVAMVLIGKGGTPLHTFYARSVAMRAEAGALQAGAPFTRQSVGLALARPPRWWRDVEAMAFLKMSYHPLQRLDDQEIWRAMRRAVWHFTGGQGTEQRG